MNMFKKKLGAGILSLAMLFGGGLLHTTYADDEIHVNGSEGSTNTDSDSSTETSASSANSVKGAQVGNPTGYAVNVTWGAMEFVYDKGDYSTTTGGIGRASEVEGIERKTSANDNAVVGKWYGFTGTNNKVEVENISTDSINFSAAVTLNSQYVATSGSTNDDHVTASLYRAVGTSEAGTDITSFISHSPASGKKWVEYEPVVSQQPNTITLARMVGETGPKDALYLNLHGDPGENISSSASSMSPIGTMTLTFSHVS